MIPKKITAAGVCIVLALFSSFVVYRINNDLRIEKIEYALENYSETYSQQKVYLHLDKPYYEYGDIIWIKAYLINALNHLPNKRSTNLYVELISPLKRIVETKRFRLKEGFAKGDFMIRDTMPEGLYQIRAYTNWMRNFDPGFYYTRNIPIINPEYKTHISPGDSKKNRRILKRHQNKLKEFDFQFLPEGGNMVYGLTGKVGFKAVNRSGKGVDVAGTIFDSGKNPVVSFSTHAKGMGHFYLKPLKGRKYYAIVESDQESFKVNLPVPMEKGIVMNVDNSSADNIHVRLTSNRFRTNDRYANEFVLVGQSRGKIRFSQIIDLSKDSAEVTVDKYLFPTGISQLTVFSGRLIPVAERLVFINHKDFITFSLKSAERTKKDSLILRIESKDNSGSLIQSDCSMALLDADNLDENRYNHNIVHYLVLTSDLKGYVEDPRFYFANSDAFTEQAMDNLMMTQGWRRFDWGVVLSGKQPELKYEIEKNITIEGKITREFFDIPLPNCDVRLSILDQYNDLFYTRSDKNGSYKFDNLVYYDTVNVKIEANKPSGRKNLVIILPEPEPEEIHNYYGDLFLTTSSTRDNKAYRRKMHIETLKREEEKKAIEAERNQITGIYGEPDDIIRGEDIPEGYTNVIQAIQGRVPGVDVQGNNVIIRGIKTIYGSTEPLYVIDGIPVENVQSVLNIPIHDVDRIEILKGASTAIYGSRGANGVIAVYTKRGEFMVKGRLEFQMLGFATPRKFYQPGFSYSGTTYEYRPVTLGWIPDLKTDGNGCFTIRQSIPENVKRVMIKIEGISKDGIPGSAEFLINL
ncbi:MAG: TonB-dependent receptor plug domain-containing protein [Bacteroidales bacterium]|nr:TonB-dependent receptor plug domain-containing protein [Bacteroidales bacterium]